MIIFILIDTGTKLILSGEVTLHDLKLRREALDKFNLPVDVLEGKKQTNKQKKKKYCSNIYLIKKVKVILVNSH